MRDSQSLLQKERNEGALVAGLGHRASPGRATMPQA